MLKSSIRGCPTRPTAATASVPTVLTMTVSAMPIALISTISRTEGTASRANSRYIDSLDGISPTRSPSGSIRPTLNKRDINFIVM